jgi:hypothetical protein
MIGIALSATSGFRVFVPFLVLSAANLAGWLELGESFAWIGTYPALVMFAVATLVEILAYFIPWVDNVLNVISVPASLVAGTILTYAVIGSLNPALAWVISIIGGGGASLLTRAVSNIVHAGSAAASGGVANPAVSLVESAGTVALSVLAIVVPIIVILSFLLLISWARKHWLRLRPKKH